MSLLERIQRRKSESPKLIVLAGRRFGGKSSSLGTLPGKTLIIEITDKEAGAEGAISVARQNGNEIDIVTAIDCKDATELTKEALEADYDYVAVDGLSALSEVEAEKPKVKKMLDGTGNSVFVGWRMIGNELIDFLQSMKQLSLQYNKPVIVTLALAETKDKEGNITSVDPACKGNMALEFIKGKVKYFVTARRAQDDKGNEIYVLQTRDDEVYPARLDGVLAKDRPAGYRTEIDKVPEGQKVGFAALLDFLNNYW